MKILFLSQILPWPLDSGVKFRTYYTLRQLASRHQVTLACFVRPDNTPDQLEHMGKFCQGVYPVLMKRSRPRDARFLAESLVRNRSFILARDRVAEMERLVDRLVTERMANGEPYDAVHCDQLWMAQYARRASGIAKVLDQHNAVYLIPQRMAQHEHNPLKRLFLELEWHKLRREEAQACQGFDHILAVTEADRASIEGLLPGKDPKVTSLPICLDPGDIQPVVRRPDADTILHLGTMFWPPNVDGVLWFARQVFPKVRALAPHARLVVAGKNPPPPVQALSLQAGIEVPGYVADPQPLMQRCAAFIVPVRAGGGMRVKIVDGWLRGLPVVSTTIGAEGIDLRQGENILIADEPGDFARQVARLLNEPGLASCLAENGRRWAEAHYDWRKVYPVLDEIYTQLRSTWEQ